MLIWNVLRLWTEGRVLDKERKFEKWKFLQGKRRASLRGSSRCHESEWPTIKLPNTRDCIITRTKSCKFKANQRVGLPATSRTSSSADLSSIAVPLKDRLIIANCSISIIGLFPMALRRTWTRNGHWSIMGRELERISRIIVKVRMDLLNFEITFEKRILEGRSISRLCKINEESLIFRGYCCLRFIKETIS